MFGTNGKQVRKPSAIQVIAVKHGAIGNMEKKIKFVAEY